MKKKRWKKVLGAALVLTMAAGLGGCGGVSADPELAKQGVYRWEEFSLPDFGTTDYGINSVAVSDGRIYMVVNVYNWEAEDPGDYMKYYLVSGDEKGGDLQSVVLQTSLEGQDAQEDEARKEEASSEPAGTAEASSAEASSGEASSAEASAEEGASASSAAAVDVAEVPMEPADVGGQRYESTNLGSMLVAPGGAVYGVKNYYMEDYTDPENPIQEEGTFICRWDLDGSMLWEESMEGLQTEDSYSYINNITLMSDGTLGLLINGDKKGLIRVDADGAVSKLEEFNTEDEIFQNVENFYMKPDGSVLLVYHEQSEDSYTMKITTYDMETGTLGEGSELPSGMAYNYYDMKTGVNTDFIFTTSEGVYTYNVGDAEVQQMMSYINSDLASRNLSNITPLDEDSFLAFYNDSNGKEGGMKGGIFTKVAPEDIPDKKVIVLAGNYINYNTMNRVVEFNKENEEYRIVVKDYSTYNSYDDYMAGSTQLNNDIIAGNMPDILCLESGIPVDNYISKGLLADVGKLIEEDEELSQVEFMENVFDAYRVDGKLYEVIPSFTVRTMIAKSALVGDRTSWTVEDLMALMETLPEDTEFISEMTQENFMSQLLQYCGSDFVDISTGKCAFDSQNFISMLELAATLPKSSEKEGEDYDEAYWQEYWENYYTQYRDEKTLLEQCYISNIRNLNYNINGEFGEDVSFIGFPTESGQGSIIYSTESYALSSKSANLDGAWQFVRYYLTEEYQKDSSQRWGLPIQKEYFMEQAQEATKKPTYEDENGNLVEYEETYWMNEEQIPLPPLNQEQVDEIVEVISSVTKKQYYNEDVQNIITEEAAAFFSGQKSAQEVANVIQSRVQLYVNENR